jgi:hypothetical protein
MKHLITLLFLFSLLPAMSQKLPEVDALNRVILNHKDSIIYAHVMPAGESPKVKVSDEYWYTWYAQHDIKETRGGFDGKLLHGNYTIYYENKDLRRKGVFKEGLKIGKWKSWHRNGQLSEISYYKKGLSTGKWISYDPSGNIIAKTKYKKGKMIVKKSRKVKNKSIKDTVQTEGNKKIKKGKKESGKKLKNKKSDDPDQLNPEIPMNGEEKKEDVKKGRRKKEKTPSIRLRRSIKVVPQPGKTT